MRTAGISETAIYSERPQEIRNALWRASPSFATAATILKLPTDLTGVLGEGVLLAQELLHPDFIASQRHRDPFLDFLRQFKVCPRRQPLSAMHVLATHTPIDCRAHLGRCCAAAGM